MKQIIYWIEFKALVIRMLTELGKRIDEHSEDFNKLEDIKKNQSALKNIITEMKITLEGINSRLVIEEHISDLEDRIVEITQPPNQNSRKKKK